MTPKQIEAMRKILRAHFSAHMIDKLCALATQQARAIAARKLKKGMGK